MRLETPACIGSATRASARSRSASVRPWRSVPKASSARGGSAAGSNGSPSGSSASSGGRSEAPRRSAGPPRRPAGAGQLRGAHHRQGEVQPGRAAQRVRLPWIDRAGGDDTGHVAGRRHPHAGAHVEEVARVLKQHARPLVRVEALAPTLGRGPRRHGDHAGARHARREPGEGLLVDDRHQLAEATDEIRREHPGELLELLRLGADDHVQRRAEAQRVLKRVEALDDRAPRVAPGLEEVGHQTPRGGRCACLGHRPRLALEQPCRPRSAPGRRP